MGSPMSENLIKAGYSVTGFTLEQDKLDRLTAAGGTAAASIAEAVKDADVVITMVPASPQVEAISYGENGILENAKSGALIVDMSSITPQTWGYSVWRLTLSQAAPVLPYLLLVLMLIVRPRGHMATRED